MPAWVWTALCVIVGVVLWRATFRVMAADIGIHDGEDLCLICLVVTLTFAFVGPFALIFSALGQFHGGEGLDIKRTARILGGEARSDKRKRRERELREREARVRQAERELGIGQ